MTHKVSVGRGNRHTSPKYGSFRVKFSALSLASNACQLFGKSRHLTSEKSEYANSEADYHELDGKYQCSGDTSPCFVTFSVKVYYKERSVGDGWQLCSTVETKPILARFEEKSSGMSTCLLRHTERVPLFLDSSISSATFSDGKGPTGDHYSSSFDLACVSSPTLCRGSNHLLESHRFKVALGVAIIRSGKVIYVGHGCRALRAIDLFGKRISMEIYGDSCNKNDHSLDVVSNACVFFDIHVKYVQWVPCTEHCRLFHDFPEQSKSHRSCDLPGSPLDPDDINHSTPLQRDIVPVTAPVLGLTADMWDEGDRETTSDEDFQPESQTSTFIDDVRYKSPPWIPAGPPSSLAKPSVKSSVYVGSDPKYRISVLDINNLSSNLNHAKVTKTRYKMPSKAYSQDIGEVHVVEEGAAVTLPGAVPEVEHVVEAPSPLESREEPEEASANDNGNGFFTDLLRTVFGGDDEGPTEAAPRLEESIENVGLIELPLEVPERSIDIKKLVKRGAQESKVSCLLKIGYETDVSLGPSMLTSIRSPLTQLVDRLSDIVSLNDQRLCIRSIFLKPNDLGLFIFTVRIPEDQAYDLAYTKKALERFSNLPSNAISEVAFLLDIVSSQGDCGIDQGHLKGCLEDIKLDCGMRINHVDMGSTINLVNVFNNGASCEPRFPLRKFCSDTALYSDPLLFKPVEGVGDVGHLRYASARDPNSVDTWMTTIKRILLSDTNSDLIQITSPRTAMPIHIDQNWVFLLKQLLYNIKTDRGFYQADEAVKFIWPTL
ncbi:hypothetical protein X943_002926 [Babesia divergens]|uniref:Uncharacterized protein n=1 Tax=Babesia divergens TaxID=32595 RepID=A0AAD9LI80_BABDI|nr:hypothetical protein X943_002926 [Babesia divergens]